MYETIKNFNLQFGYQPKIENRKAFKKFQKFVVAGMGGSHLAGDLIKTAAPEIDIVIHSDYGLPPLPEPVLKNSLLIASSYSGNTEETIDAFRQATKKKVPVAVVSTGGKLLLLAKKHRIPYIQLPDTGIQPRMSLGYGVLALLKLMGEEMLIKELGGLSGRLKPAEFEKGGQRLAKRLTGKIPVIYASAKNYSIAYNWKIKINETGKIPAFYNVVPELNHNEMTGFDVKKSTKNLSKNFYFIFLNDPFDHPRVIKRMEILETLYRCRGLKGEKIELDGVSPFHKIFSSFVLADWAAYWTAVEYGLEAEQVPMVEEFKKLVVKQ